MSANQPSASDPAARRLAKNTAALVLLRVVMPGLSMALVFAISRTLGTEGLGTYTLAFTYLYFFVTIAPLGLYSIISRDGARDTTSLDRTLAHSLTLATLASLAMTAAMILLGPALGYDANAKLALTAASFALVPSTLGTLLDAAFIARERMDYLAYTTVAENVVKVGLGVSALALGGSLTTVIALAVVGRYFGCIVGVVLLRALGVNVTLGRERAELGRLLLSAPTFVSIAVFSTLYWRLDVFMLSKMGSVEELGRYSAAWRLLELALVVPQSFCLALYPQIVAAVRTDRAELARLGKLAMRYLAAGSLPIAACITAVSDDVMLLLYGKEFGGAGSTLTVLVWTLVPYGWVRYHAYVLVAADRQNVDLLMNVLLTAVNAGLNLFLIPAYGPWGAGVATFVSMMVYAVAQVAYLARYAPGTGSPLSLSALPLIAAIAAGLSAWLLDGHNLAVRAVVPLAVYCAVLFGCGFFERSELRAMQHLWRRCLAFVPGRRALSS
jgi:O-antigen/teichoic acid export membrane protein